MLLTGACAEAAVLFEDRFEHPGDHPNLLAWTTEFGDASFLGRTQLADWVTAGGVGRFSVDVEGARLTVTTYNPTGLSFYGTHAKTLTSFSPTATTAIEFTALLRLTSLPPGVVVAMYLYGCAPSECATRHDEIDLEIIGNLVAPSASTPAVHLNTYRQEPLGAGHPVLAGVAGLDVLTEHAWTIRWSLDSVTYLVDGEVIHTSTEHVPQGAMQASLIAWAPASDWSTAYSPLVQPTPLAAEAQSFGAVVRSVRVSEVPAVPEPTTWAMLTTGLLLVLGMRRRTIEPTASVKKTVGACLMPGDGTAHRAPRIESN